MIQIVLIDRQEQDRKNAELILSAQRDFKIVGMGKDGYEAIRLAGMYQPDIALMDVDLPYINGVNIAAILKCRFPHIGIIILTCLDDDTHALNAFRNGVSGYLLKSKDMERLAAVIREVHEGGCHLSPHIAARVFPKVSRIAQGECPLTPDPYFPVNLTRTEMQIIHYVGRGLENQEIAEKLCLKIGTVRNHITVILQKTVLRNRVQLAVFAVQNGLTQEYPEAPVA